MRVNADSFRLPKQGNFVAFEGINGCGKTTLLRALSQRLKQASTAVLETREPGGTPLGEELRKLLLEWSGEKKSDRTELLLFAASRTEAPGCCATGTSTPPLPFRGTAVVFVVTGSTRQTPSLCRRPCRIWWCCLILSRVKGCDE